MTDLDPKTTALMLIDMQNDFLHPEGAYGRAGQKSEAIAALAPRLVKVAKAMRQAGDGSCRPISRWFRARVMSRSSRLISGNSGLFWARAILRPTALATA